MGMGNNIYLGDRHGVRTPMQWTGDRNAGFSRADPARLFAPVIMDPVYGYQSVNVESQERSPFSLLNWMKRMIALRKQFKVFGRGTLEFLPAPNRKILAYVRRYEDELVLCIANLSRAVQPVELDLSAFAGMTPVEMLGLTEFPKIAQHPYFLTIPPYYFYWFRLQLAPAPVTALRAPETTAPVDAALPAFFMGVTWDTLLDGNVRTLIERESLVPFLQRQRWFGGKARAVRAARFLDWGPLRRGPHPIIVTIVGVDYEDCGSERYLVPLAVVTRHAAEAILARAPQAAVAHVTGARKGVVIDGTADDLCAQALLETFDADAPIRTRRGCLRPRRTPAFQDLRGDGALAPKRVGVEQSNTSIAYGDRLMLKLFPRVGAVDPRRYGGCLRRCRPTGRPRPRHTRVAASWFVAGDGRRGERTRRPGGGGASRTLRFPSDRGGGVRGDGRCGARRCRLQDPHPRGLSPRPGALGRGRFLHPGFRGGAGASAR